MAYIYVIVAAVLWGIIGIFSKALVAQGFAPTQIVFVRAFGAMVCLLAYLGLTNRRSFKIAPRDSFYFVGTGIISFVFFNWCYFNAIEKTSLSIAAILLYTAPTIVTFLSAILFKEQMTVAKWASLGLTFAGCLLVTVFSSGEGLKTSGYGILLGLGSGLGYALYSIFGRYALKKYSVLTVTFYTFAFATLGLLPITNVQGMVGLLSHFESQLYSLGLCLFSTVAPFLLYTKGLSRLETSKASIIATLEPIVATVVGVLLFAEPITAVKMLGILLVLWAVKIL